MNDITKKLNALREAGFEPVSILMSRWLYQEIMKNNNAGDIEYSRNGDDLVATMKVMRDYNGLPVHVCLDNNKSFSIEVQ